MAGAWLLSLAVVMYGAFGPMPGRPWPDFLAIKAGWPESWRLYDRNGAFLRDAANESGERYLWLDSSRLPDLVRDAAIASEDARFYSHLGVDIRAVGRAVLGLFGGGGGGASTISMQTARLVYGHPRTLMGKIGQTVDAVRLELALNKVAILTIYLNRVPLGGPAVGIEAASRYWFGKPAEHLSLGEAAGLVGMIQAPGRYDPVQHVDDYLARRAYVLGRMAELGMVTKAERLAAQMESVQTVGDAVRPKAMHATDWALGLDPPRGELRLCLDLGLNQALEALAREHAATSPGAEDAAIVVLDNSTMEVLAMVGSPDYWRPETGSVNGALSPRQPGSTLKPFAYALAFEGRWDSGSILADVPILYHGADGMLYEPRNHSGEFLGPVTAYEALGRSLNVPALRLVNELGLGEFADMLNTLGVGDYRAELDRYGLGLVLGSAETSLLALTHAYSALATGGVLGELKAWVGQQTGDSRRVYSARAAWMVSDILQDERVRMRAFGENNPLLFGFPLAVKTGTSENWRDNWAIGYNERYTLAVWAGNFSGQPTDQLSGSTGAGPLFHKAAYLLLGGSGHAAADLSPPDGIVRLAVCPVSGALPGPHCPGAVTLPFKEENTPTRQCGVHVVVMVDSRDGSEASSATPESRRVPSLRLALGPEYDAWLEGQGALVLRAGPDSARAQAATVTVEFPLDGDRFIIEPGYDERRQSLELRADCASEVQSVAWYVNGSLLANVRRPFTADLVLQAGEHRITALGMAAGSAPPPARLPDAPLDGELGRSSVRIQVQR